MFIVLCLLSGLFIAVQGISYKLVPTYKCDGDRFLLILVWLAVLYAGVGVIVSNETLSDRVVLMGSLAAGVCAFLALRAIIQAMATGPVSFTWVLANLSIGVPILLSAVIWSEPIRAIQWLGLGLFVVSLVLFGKDLQRGGSKGVTLKWVGIAAIMFLANGSALLCFKVINRYASVSHTFSTLVITYTTCGILLLGCNWRKLTWPHAAEMKLSLIAAAGMMGGQALIIRALAINTASSLPIIHSTSIIAVAIASALMFGERLTRYSGSGLLCGLVSISLLTLG
jgi:drug/metabolite transporter (DMT)-like permease